MAGTGCLWLVSCVCDWLPPHAISSHHIVNSSTEVEVIISLCRSFLSFGLRWDPTGTDGCIVLGVGVGANA